MSLREKRGAFGASSKSEGTSEFETEAFSDRLRALIGEGSANGFAKECGIGETSIRQYLRGGVPGLDKVVQIARAKKVHVDWLATGEGPRDIEPDYAITLTRTDGEQNRTIMVQAKQNTAPSAPIRLLPRLAVEASAGKGIIPPGEDVEGYVAISEEYLREIGVDPRYAHILRVSGRSMAPTINDKDVVIIDTSVRTVASEGVYSLVYGDAVLIKRIRLLRDGGLTLVSDNKSEGYLDETVPRSEMATLSIVGRVKGHIRSL